MDLKGLNVLVDGYNLELPKGTGIKTYGVSLINALKLLGANVNVLYSRNRSSIPVLNEVLFFDVLLDDQKKQQFKLIKNLVKTVGKIVKTETITIGKNIVIRESDNLMDSVGILNLEGCYKIAHIKYKLFNLITKITPSQKIDIWHTTYPLPIKIRGAKKITTIHDLIPLRLPYTTLDDKSMFYRNVKDSLKDSAIIIAVSKHTKKDIIDIFDINPDKIHVTYQPTILSPFSFEEDKALLYLKKYKLEYNNYILFVGAIEPKKNIGRLIDAYSMIKTDLPLVIVGKKSWLWENELNTKNLDNVRLLEYVSTDDLRYLYVGAHFFVFPSLYEGFGLPVLEAMTFGRPVITSNISSLPEVCGDAALYVNPYDIFDIKEKIEKLLNDSQLRTKLSEVGKKQAKVFSMENYTKRLCEAYLKVL